MSDAYYMITSYILVQLEPGMASAAVRAISKIEGVAMAHAVTGPFDVIAFAQVPDLESLSNLVLSRIQRVKGVEKTQTAVVVTSGTRNVRRLVQRAANAQVRQ